MNAKSLRFPALPTYTSRHILSFAGWGCGKRLFSFSLATSPSSQFFRSPFFFFSCLVSCFLNEKSRGVLSKALPLPVKLERPLEALESGQKRLFAVVGREGLL